MQTRRRAGPGGRRVRRGPGRRRRRLRRGAVRPRAARGAGPVAGGGGRGRAGGLPGRHPAGRRDRSPDPGRLPAHRDAARRPLPGDRRARRALPRPGRGRLRHRRRRGRVPAHPAPGRLRVPAPAERALHHPRRRGRSGCRRSGRRCSGAAPTGSGTACASSTTSPLGADGTPRLGLLAAYVRDKRIPLEMCPTSNVHTGAAKSLADHPIGLLADAALPGHRQHRQPADVRRVDDQRADRAGRHVRLRLGRPAVVHGERHEVGVPRLRRAARR